VRWLSGRRRRGVRPDRADRLGVAPDDAADLAGRLAAVEADEGEDRDRRLARRLDVVVTRRVPVRVVEAVPTRGAARVRFADGTAVFVRGVIPGDVGVLASWVAEGSVLPQRCSTEADGTHLDLASPSGRRTLSIVVTGYDQPD
jgi:hypothetical protein